MLEACRRRGLYDGLFESDVAAFLSEGCGGTEPYDLLLSADLFIYIGDLVAVFAAARERMRPGGLFVFSVERLDDGEATGGGAGDYALRPSGRYAQSAAYVRRLAAAHGFAVLSEQSAPLREAQGQPIPGLVYALRAS
jgi:predicted TPR repeat methyltransferase